MATGGRLSKVWLTSLNRPTLKTPYCVQVSWTYLLPKLSYSRFCVENRKFSFPWQQGSVIAKLDWHSLIGRPRKPYHRTKNYDSILYTTGITANLLLFMLKFLHFRYHGNGGRHSKVWLTPLNRPTLKTPYCVQTSGPYLLHKLSYSQFSVENRTCSLPRQQGSFGAKFDWHSLIGRPQKPYIEAKITTLSYIQPELWQFKDFPIETMVIFSSDGHF